MENIRARIIGYAVFFFSFLFYLLNIYPSITNGDSGEFLAVAYTLGIAHPSGYPIYLIILKIFISILPFNSALAGNIMSGFFASLSAFLLYKNFLLFYKIFFNEKLNFSVNIISGIITLITSAIPIIVSQAIITEVYTLNLFFILLLNLIFMNFVFKRDLKYVYFLAFISGLSLTNHLTPVLILPFYWLYIFLNFLKREKAKGKIIFNILILFLLGFSVYFYLIIRGGVEGIVKWSDTSNIQNALEHIIRKEYRESERVLERDFIYFLKQILEYLKIILNEFNFYLIFILTGIIFSFRMNLKKVFFIILLYLVLSAGFIYITNFRINRHLIYVSRVFYIPSLVLLQFFAFIFFVELIRSNKIFWGLLILSLIFFAFKGYNSQLKNYIAYDFSRNILKTIYKDGVLCTVEGDNPLFALGYLRYVEYIRPDVVYLNRYGKIFSQTSEYFSNMISIENKNIYFTSPERIEKEYEKYLKQLGILYYLYFKEHNFYFLNYYYLRTGKRVTDYMDKGLAAIYYYRLAYFYKEYLHNETNYWLNLKFSEIYGDELKDIQYILGNLYYSLARYTDAKKCFGRVIKLFPEESKAYFYYGLCEIKLNNYLEAIKYLDIAKRKGEKSVEFYKALAYAYYKLNRLYEAIIYLEEAIKLYPSDFSLKSTLRYYESLLE